MAVANTFTFGSISSSTYGVVVEGSGDYSAPKRDVEMIEIPGRNGSFALDRGRFENITVEYDCVIQNTTQATFEASVASFRNAIVSQKGYQRLTDTYHPNEYRMAVYAGGFDEAPAFHGKGAVFKVKFDCKPQRYLTSGETAVTVANNGTMSNPTLFESSPLLAVKGYGTITVNDFEITLENVTLGNIEVYGGYRTTSNLPTHIYFNIDTSQLNTGDNVTLAGIEIRNNIVYQGGGSPYSLNQINLSSVTNIASYSKQVLSGTSGYISFIPDNFVVAVGTASTSPTSSIHSQAVLKAGQVTSNYSCDYTYYCVYDGDTQIDIYLTGKINNSNFTNTRLGIVPTIVAYSTVSVLPSPVYVDLDIGEAYGEYSGVVRSANNAVQLPAELPTLAPGTNTFTKDNTITELKITPRWWKL